jgi:hypothetical protein
MLRRSTAPLSLDKSTLFMVIASTNSTDGRGFPTVTGDPRSLMGFPLKFTCSPGMADAISTGIFGWVDAQPKIATIRKDNKTIRFLLDTILTSSFSLISESSDSLIYK